MFLGMVSNGDPKDIRDDYCREMQNLEPKPAGAISVRKGFVKQNATSLGSATRGLFGYKPRYSETRVIVVAHSTKLETV
jgi:hypothetical protein